MDPIALTAGTGQVAAGAGGREAELLHRTAEEFEGLFLGLLMKTMRSAQSGGVVPEGSDGRMYREMFDMEVGRSLARAGGVGLARMIERAQEKVVKAGARPADIPSNGRSSGLDGGSGEDTR